MKYHYKEQFDKLVRYQTSLGRNLSDGLRLDRNEKITNFSQEIMDQIFNKFETFSFSASPESTTLYNKIAKSVGLKKENIFVTSGITEGIRVLYETLTKPGDNVIVLDPTYPFYSIYAKMYQVEYRKLGFKDDLNPDWDSLIKKMDSKTTLLMIPNPNLPIESVLTLEEIRIIADRCRENKTILIIDEAYHYFGGPSVIELIEEYDNLVVMRTFSKAYGLAGIRLGFMISSINNINYLAKTRSLVESNTFSMGIAEYMLDHPEIKDQHVEEVKEGGRYIQNELTNMGLRWHGGSFTNGILIFLDNKKETEDVINYLKERKIYIRGSFTPPFDNCIRVSIGARYIMKIFFKNFREWYINKRI